MKKEVKKIIIKATAVTLAANVSRKIGETLSIKILDMVTENLNK